MVFRLLLNKDTSENNGCLAWNTRCYDEAKMLRLNQQTTGVCEKNIPFPWALAMRPSSRKCNPAPDLVLSKLIFPHVFSRWMFLSQTPYIYIYIYITNDTSILHILIYIKRERERALYQYWYAALHPAHARRDKVMHPALRARYVVFVYWLL